MEFAADAHLVMELAKTGEKVAVTLALDLLDKQTPEERRERVRLVAHLLRKLKTARNRWEKFPHQLGRIRTVSDAFKMLQMACDELAYREEKERDVRLKVVDFLKSHRLKTNATTRDALDDYLGENYNGGEIISVELLESDAIVGDFSFEM
jgi:hypothetical protein